MLSQRGRPVTGLKGRQLTGWLDPALGIGDERNLEFLVGIDCNRSANRWKCR